MKVLLILIMALYLHAESALEISLKSTHYNTDVNKYLGDYKMNENNTGVFYSHNKYFIGGYKNSFYRNSFVLGYTPLSYKYKDIEANIDLYGVTGYDKVIHHKGNWYQPSTHKVQPVAQLRVVIGSMYFIVLPNVALFGVHIKI